MKETTLGSRGPVFKAPGIALNILRNKSALVMGICTTFTCFKTRRPRKRGFLQDFLSRHRYHFDGRGSSESKEPRLFEIKANAVIY